MLDFLNYRLVDLDRLTWGQLLILAVVILVFSSLLHAACGPGRRG